MRNSPIWWIILGLMVLVDLYFFQALKVVTHSAASRTRTIIHVTYWVISAGAVIVLLLLPYINFEKNVWVSRSTVFTIIVGLFLAKLVASFFFLVDDLRRLVQWVSGQFFLSKPRDGAVQINNGISRSVFLSWVGMVAGGGMFGTLIHGFGNKYRYQVKKIPLAYSNLPAAFKGLKIVHISDIHSGSFNDKKAVIRGVEKIMHEKPDLILFTGDLVNNVAEEMDDYIDVFDKLKAPMGVYSTLGNHDYGEYVHWNSPEERKANLEKLKGVHAQMGWRLLMNEHVVLERDGDKIALLGIENWSAKGNFPKYGDLKKAYAGTETYPFKILMSHDPSHWKGQVCEDCPDIDLMLSGHTHGMQFGVELPGFRWSPVQYMYREWAGLYEDDRRKLYVNRGFGFIGYHGRVGILPEITVLELV